MMIELFEICHVWLCQNYEENIALNHYNAVTYFPMFTINGKQRPDDTCVPF